MQETDDTGNAASVVYHVTAVHFKVLAERDL